MARRRLLELLLARHRAMWASEIPVTLRDEGLQGVNLCIERGEIMTIVGPNGSGKSTLLRAMIRAVTPNSGTVSRAPGLRIGYVPQRLHIDPRLPC